MATLESSNDTPKPAFRPPTFTITRGADHELLFDPPAGSKELAEALSLEFPGVIGMDKKMRAAIEAFLRVQASKLKSPSPEAEGTGGFADVPHLAPDHETHLSSEAQASTTCKDQVPLLGHSIREVSEVPSSNTKNTPQIPASVALEPHNRKTVSDPKNPLSTLQWSQWAPHTQGAKRVEKKRHRRNFKAEERRKIFQNRGMACDKHRLRKVTCNPDFCPENKQNVNKKKSMQKFETLGATSTTNDVVDKMASAQGVLPPAEANLKYRAYQSLQLFSKSGSNSSSVLSDRNHSEGQSLLKTQAHHSLSGTRRMKNAAIISIDPELDLKNSAGINPPIQQHPHLNELPDSEHAQGHEIITPLANLEDMLSPSTKHPSMEVISPHGNGMVVGLLQASGPVEEFLGYGDPISPDYCEFGTINPANLSQIHNNFRNSDKSGCLLIQDSPLQKVQLSTPVARPMYNPRSDTTKLFLSPMSPRSPFQHQQTLIPLNPPIIYNQPGYYNRDMLPTNPSMSSPQMRDGSAGSTSRSPEQPLTRAFSPAPWMCSTCFQSHISNPSEAFQNFPREVARNPEGYLTTPCPQNNVSLSSNTPLLMGWPSPPTLALDTYTAAEFFESGPLAPPFMLSAPQSDTAEGQVITQLTNNYLPLAPEMGNNEAEHRRPSSDMPRLLRRFLGGQRAHHAPYDPPLAYTSHFLSHEGPPLSQNSLQVSKSSKNRNIEVSAACMDDNGHARCASPRNFEFVLQFVGSWLASDIDDEAEKGASFYPAYINIPEDVEIFEQMTAALDSLNLAEEEEPFIPEEALTSKEEKGEKNSII